MAYRRVRVKYGLCVEREEEEENEWKG